MQTEFYRLEDTDITLEQFQRTLLAAKEALAAAYQPYSKYRVGAAVFSPGGGVFKGCNVETANYDGTHAEESALVSMVTAGWRDPVLCVCLAALEGQKPAFVMSCGKCRQSLFEFASLSGREMWLPLGSAYVPPGSNEHWFVKISDLLPYSFGPADIGVDVTRYRR